MRLFRLITASALLASTLVSARADVLPSPIIPRSVVLGVGAGATPSKVPLTVQDGNGHSVPFGFLDLGAQAFLPAGAVASSGGDLTATFVKLFGGQFLQPITSAMPLTEASFGLVDDPTCALDQTKGLQAAVNSTRRVVLGAGTFCIKSATGTLQATTDGSRLSGLGSRTTIKWAAPAGTPIAPIADVIANNVRWDNINFDANAVGTTYKDNQYVQNGNVIASAAVLIEGDDFTGENLLGTHAFDNCFALGRIVHPSGDTVRGRPLRPHLIHPVTNQCGVGQHANGDANGGPAFIGAGVDNASAYGAVIDDPMDTESYGSFISDIGAGASGVWNNIVSIGSNSDFKHNLHTPALYVGDGNSSFNNVYINLPHANGMFADYYTGGTMMTNVNIKGPGEQCIYIKGAPIIHGFSCQDPSSNASGAVEAIKVDSSAGPIAGLVMDGVSVTSFVAKPSIALNVLGTNNAIGLIVFTTPPLNGYSLGSATGLSVEAITPNGMAFGAQNAQFNWDYTGSVRFLASGATKGYAVCTLGDGCDTTSTRVQSSTFDVLAFGYDPTLKANVMQGIHPGVAKEPIAINPSGASVLAGSAAPSLGDGSGYLAISGVAGKPTGVPQDVPPGMNAMRYDTAGHRLWVYDWGQQLWLGSTLSQ